MKILAGLLPLFAAIIMAVLFFANGFQQELPTGTVIGTATMAESGLPLPKAVIYFSPARTIDGMNDRSVRTDSQGRFIVKNLVAGAYHVTASARAHEMEQTSIQVDEGKLVTLDAPMTPRERYVNLNASQHVYAPGAKPDIQMNGFIRSAAMKLTITRLDPEGIAKQGGLLKALQPLNSNGRTVEPDSVGATEGSPTILKLKQDVEGVFHQRLDMPHLGEGLYWVEVAGDGAHHGTFLNVTNFALITKSVAQKALTYTVDIESGQPLKGVPLFVATPTGLKQIGSSDDQGLAEIQVEKGSKSVILARHGASLAFCDQGYDRGDRDHGPDTVFVYTDRSIYRPGDTIQYKGIVRRLNGLDYTLPRGGPVKVEFLDSDRNVVAKAGLVLSSHGTFHGSFSTSKEAAPSDFRIVADYGASEGHAYVPVEAYRKPDYSVTVRPEKPYYVQGETGRATVECEYYFGGPVVGAKVNVNVYRNPLWGGGDSSDETDQDNTPDDQGFEGGEYDASYKVVTDANGKATIEFPTRVPGDPQTFPTDFSYTVSASVADEGNHFFEGTGEVRVLRGDVDLSIDSLQNVAQPGDTVHLTAKVRSSDDQTPVSQANVELEVGHIRWVKEVSQFTSITTLKGTTDSSGNVSFDYRVAGQGALILRGRVPDRKGRIVHTESEVYVSGDDEFGPQRSETISATLDRKRYEIGQAAKLLLQTDSPGGSALVTIEVGSILSKQVVKLDQRSTVVNFPVSREMAPNAYVSAVYVHGEQYMETSKQILVARHDRDLQIRVTPDRSTAQPGEVVTFAVETKDASGKPISANTSLAVVDESLYAVRHDTTDIRRSFYPHRGDEVSTNYSFAEVYLDGGDKGTGKIPVRSKFRDTADWEPEVQTDANGHASVRVTLPDNLTQWRATAVGCTDIAEVGSAKAFVVARKDLMVRIQTPSYLVAGDHQHIAVTVTNDTGRDADVSLNIQLSGVRTGTNIPEKLHVQAGKPESLELDVEAAVTGDATMTAQAKLPSGGGDAVRMTLPILPHGRAMIDAKAGVTTGEAKLEFERRTDADPHVGRLRLVLAPSIATGMVRAANALVDFPYGCVEQTMSRFLPSVLVARAVTKVGLPSPKLAPKIPEIAADSFVRLSRMQHQDGGWGWWDHDTNDLFMTALVLDGLKRASDAGFPTPASIDVTRALHWAAERILKPDRSDSRRDRIYLSYVLARHGRPDSARSVLKDVIPGSLSDSELALAALARGASGGRFDDLLSGLRRRARGSGGNSYWLRSAKEDAWGAEPTALALVAFTTLAPKDPIIGNAVHFLMATRTGDGWGSTRETAYVLIGLTRYLEGAHEFGSPFDETVRIGGRLVRTVHLDPRAVDVADAVIDIPIGSLTIGKNTVEITRTGNGSLYYTAELQQVATSENLDAVSPISGLSVMRRYYVMEARKLPDGTMRLVPSEQVIDKAPSGSIIRCEVVVTTSEPRRYIQIESPSPSNCRITERSDDDVFDSWSWWWSSTVVRDDRISFFSRDIPAGVSKMSYNMRTESPGLARGLPAIVSNMYDPLQRADSAENPMTVTP